MSDLTGKKRKKRKKQRGITLIALVVTIIVLIILAGVSINMLVGENGIINMAQRAKNETEKARKEEEQALVGMFGKNYADYNGQLHVEGMKLKNQFNEEIVLKGLVGFKIREGSAHYGKELPFSYYLNEESIDALKSWGVNVIRIGLQISDFKDEQLKEDFYNTIDLLIKKDIYVVLLSWSSLKEGEGTDIVGEYFVELAKKYKNVPNIIYELANEPAPEISWEYIVQYSNDLISKIRDIDKNKVIIVPCPNADTRPNQVSLSDLKDNEGNAYKNIMISYHMYTGNKLTEQLIGYLNDAFSKEIPIFVTEWGTSMSNGHDGFYEAYSNAFLKLLEEYNISWCNFHLTDFNAAEYRAPNSEYAGIVKHNQWNNSLNNDILTDSGKYIKSIIMGTCDSYNNGDYAIMMERDTSKAFWQEEYINEITEIEFMKESQIPDNSISWDISFIDENKVKAYITQDEPNKLYIVSMNTIYFPINSSEFFKSFGNMKKIIFNNINTMNVQYLYYFFRDCVQLETIEGLEMWNTVNVTNIESMFTNCFNLQSLNLKGWNTKKITNMMNLFAQCERLHSIEGIEDIDTSNVTQMIGMFQGTKSLESIDLSNWKATENVTSLKFMFAWSNIREIDISNFNIKNVKEISGMFQNCSNLERIFMNNIEFNEETLENFDKMFANVKSNMEIYVKNIESAQFLSERLKENSISANLYYDLEGDWIKFSY